jgi:hypothetical protein
MQWSHYIGLQACSFVCDVATVSTGMLSAFPLSGRWSSRFFSFISHLDFSFITLSHFLFITDSHFFWRALTRTGIF